MISFAKRLVARVLGPETSSKLRIRYRNAREHRDHLRWLRTPEGRASTAGLQRLKGLHAGRRCFVIGNGPSLNQTPMWELRDEITIGCNGLFLLFDQMGFVPTYFTVEDPLVAEDRGQRIGAVKGATKVIPRDLQRFVPGDEATFWVHFRRQYLPFPQFTEDLTREVFWGGTVTYLNLQLAWHLGCNPIYLVGIDHNYDTSFKIQKDGVKWTSLEADKNHFHPDYFGKGYRWHDPNVDRMEECYRHALSVGQARGVQIFNATIGGKLEVFPRADIYAVLAAGGTAAR